MQAMDERFAEKRGFRLAHGGCAAALPLQTALETSQNDV
jgi:hypothetical protein